MQVQALCVGDADQQGPNFALVPMANFSTLPYVDNGEQKNRKPYINADVISHSGPFEGEITLPPGVHLHWALPAALTRGQQQEDGSLVYPDVPNRWLVTRLIQKNKTSSAAIIQTRSWIVESDRLNDTPVAPAGIVQPTVPTDPNVPGQSFSYIGQAFDSDGWSEDSQAKRFANLKSLGYGEASFASYYPNCSTVFGFQDDLANADYNPNYDSLSYQVTGWYSDTAQDPCAAGIVSGDNPFNWIFSGSSPDTVNNTLCSGIVENIAWNPGTTYITENNSPLAVSIGSSAQEALSALMANQSEPDEALTETILNALQFGLLTQLGTINGTIQNFEELVHEAGFANHNAGITWQVRKKTRAGSDSSYEGEITLPEPVAQDLNTLNLQQSQLDELKETLASKRWQLFSDWYKYLLVEYDTRYTPEGIRRQGQAIREYLTSQVTTINGLQEQVSENGTLQQSINTLAAFITGLLDDQYELTNDTASARYWQANNPLLVLQGDDIIPVNRTGDGELVCRIAENLAGATQLAANAVQNGQPQMSASFIDTLISFPQDTPASLLNLILNDAVLTTNTLQPAIAAKFCSAFAQEHSGQQLNFSSTVSVLQSSLALFLAGEAHPDTAYLTTGYQPADAPDTLSIYTWTATPWLPVMMQYAVEFNPVQYLKPGDAYDPEFILSRFSWDADDIELVYNQSSLGATQSYTGTMLLSADAQVNLAESIRQFIQQSGSDDPELQDVLDSVSDMPILAQELSGLSQSLLMRQQSLQMNVADPLANTFDQPFVAAVAEAVQTESVYSPEPNFSFNPLRTGTLRITGLRLIDAFGRFKDKDSVSSVTVAKGLLPPQTLNVPAGTAFLPPRITQPSRLLFRWLSASYDTIESNSHPASSPIIGWVLPDYPDNSLFIYNADGTPLGELAVSADNTAVLWFPAPGGLFPVDSSLQTVMQNQLPWLRNVAVGIYNNGNPSLLISILASLRAAAEQTLPAGSSNNTSGILTGQPLAITRASLRLDLAGDAATRESWEAFAQSVNADASPDTAGFTEVKFPVKLGMQGNLNDGLFGYWIEEDTRVDFTRFYDAGTTGAPLTLTSGYTPGSTKTVLMLVDPKGEVHATSGILPVKSIAVPSDQYDAALSSLSVTFLTAPVLSGANTTEISIPLPKINAGYWSWVNVTNGSWQSQNFSETVQNSTQGALDYTPQQLLEGWLRLRDFEN
jgi:hypothetical protein